MDEELEFATKEDLEAIKADPKLSKYYQAVQAGVTKKFQLWSGEKQKLQKTIEGLTAQVNELDSSLGEWEGWFSKNEPLLKKFAETMMEDGGGDFQDDRVGRKGGDKRKVNDDMTSRFDQLVETLNRAGSAFETRLNHMGRMLNLSMQLNDIIRAHPEVDGMKVLDTALKGGYQDLSLAYEKAYADDILNRQVEEKLKPRLEEEKAKLMTNVETGSGSVPVTSFELPKELPKSFTAAGQEFLQERAKESKKP